MAELTHYEALDVSRVATPEELRKSYEHWLAVYDEAGVATYSLLDAEQRRAARKRIEEAYRVLSDPALRAAYDEDMALRRAASGAVDAAGRVLASYPATMGSQHDPLPLGAWTIKGVSREPTFNYNPDLFWDAEAGHAKAKIPPGPNNPVGMAWIDLSKEHYGIHGSPEPSRVGKTESHGCIRLTNWDVAELAALVAPGTPAILQE